MLDYVKLIALGLVAILAAIAADWGHDLAYKVHAALMLTEITDQILSLGQGADGSIAFDSQLEDVTLYPDQAVPLSLLVAEATTNALKYMGHADAEKWLRLVLKVAETGEISVEIANGIAPAAGQAVGGDAHLAAFRDGDLGGPVFGARDVENRIANGTRVFVVK